MDVHTFLRRVSMRASELDLSERGVCVAAGLNPGALRQIRKGRTRSLTGDNLLKLAEALKVPMDWLVGRIDERAWIESTEAGSFDLVDVVGSVQAGAWREAEEYGYAEIERITVPIDDRYKFIKRRGLKVVGNSMDLVYPEGSIIFCVRFQDLNRPPRSGEKVLIQRRRDYGSLYETTVKQLIIKTDAIFLEPRSSDPRHKPIILPRNVLDVVEGEALPRIIQPEEFHLPDDTEEVAILGLVTSFYALQ